MNRIKNAFDSVRAEESLKENTLKFIQDRHIPKQRAFIPKYRYALILTAFIIVFSGIGGYSILNSAVSYISIDVNPSVELGLNRFENVVSAEGYNDDGSEILSGIDLKGKSYTEAIDMLLSMQEFDKYMDGNAVLEFTVAADNQKSIITGIKGCDAYNRYRGACHSADNELVKDAHKNGLSLGKYRAYLELSQYDSSVTAEDCRDMTMHQIHDMIDEHTDRHNNGKQRGYGHHRGRHMKE